MNAYAAATLAMEVISFKRRRRQRGLVGEEDIIDYNDNGGGGRVGDKEASGQQASKEAIFCCFGVIFYKIPM